MVMIGSPVNNLSKDQTLKQLKPSPNLSERLSQLKTSKLDLNHNNDLIEVDFDSYDTKANREIIKKIQVPIDQVRPSTTNLTNKNFEKAMINSSSSNSINDQAVKHLKPRSSSYNTSIRVKESDPNERLSQQRTSKLDINENNDLIEVDFDSYDVVTTRQVIKEIEVPVENPINNKVVNFESNQSLNRPSPRERNSTNSKELLATKINQNNEMDLASYDKYLNQPNKNVQYQSSPSNKIVS